MSANGAASRVSDGLDLTCKCCVIEKPAGSVWAGAGFDALLMNGRTSISTFWIVTLSTAIIVPVLSSGQPAELALFALSVNLPNGFFGVRSSNFSFTRPSARPAALPLPLNVWVNSPP